MKKNAPSAISVAPPAGTAPEAIPVAAVPEVSAPEEHRPGFVRLDMPLKCGDRTVDAVTVRRPGAGELRGLSISALLNLDYIALEKLLPRITVPRLNPPDVAALDPADLVQLGSEVMDFLLPREKKQALSRTE